MSGILPMHMAFAPSRNHETSLAASNVDSATHPAAIGYAVWLGLVPAVVIGFGRFAYGLILPAMRADLGWSYRQAGALNTANAAGYLVGALLCTLMVRVWGERRVLLWNIWGAALAMLGCALAAHLAPHAREAALLGLRAVVGFTGAGAFIVGAGLAARLGQTPHENALAMGCYFGAPGAGTLIAGIVLPFVLGGHGERWPLAWAMLGLLSIAACLRLSGVTRYLPPSHQPAQQGHAPAGTWRSLLLAFAAYFGFGLGYISYMTFLAAYVRGLGGTPATVALVWGTLGATMTFSGWLWRGPLAAWRGGRALALMLLGCALGGALPALSGALPVLLLSAALFGCSAMPVVTGVTAQIRQHLAPLSWSGAIAAFTVVFAVGQSLGPLASGALSDRFGLIASLWWTAGICALAACCALAQRHAAQR